MQVEALVPEHGFDAFGYFYVRGGLVLHCHCLGRHAPAAVRVGSGQVRRQRHVYGLTRVFRAFMW